MKTEVKQVLRQIVREALELARRGEHPSVADLVRRSYMRSEWMTEAAEIAAYLIDDSFPEGQQPYPLNSDEQVRLLIAAGAVDRRLRPVTGRKVST